MSKIAILLLITLCWLVPVKAKLPVVIIDAGSTGSRIHLYVPHQDSFQEIHIPHNSVSQGISTLAAQPHKAAQSLLPLLNQAREALHTHHLPIEVELKVLGTGGMRLLAPAKQKKVYSAIRKYIKQKTTFKAVRLRTISGQEEALFAWLAANELSGFFARPGVDATQGIIEIGGASVQIAFAVTNNTKENSNVTKLKIAGKTYTVFRQSYLGLGYNEVAKLIGNNPFCTPLGYYEGAFNAAKCRSVVNASLRQNSQLPKKLPLPPDLKVWGLSGLYYTMNFFDPAVSKSSLLEALTPICRQAWPIMQAQYPKIQKKYLQAFCRNGVYTDILLREIIGISITQQLYPVDQINTIKTMWPYGELLYTQKFPVKILK